MTPVSTLLHIEPHIALHAGAALSALILTPFVLWRQTRDGWHKRLGYVWVTLMAVTALSSFLISGVGGFGRFSFLHGLALLTLWTLFYAVRKAIQGDIARHRAALRNLATFGLGLPMVLNFLPGRSFSNAFFVGTPWLGLGMMFALYAVLLLWRSKQRSSMPKHPLLHPTSGHG